MDASNYLTPRHHIVHNVYEQVNYREDFDGYNIDNDETSSASISADLIDALDNPYTIAGNSTVESGMIHLPNHLTIKRAVGFKWNLPMDVRETWKAPDFNALMNSLIRIDDLYADFIRSATLNAKVLIKEHFKDHNKISASHVGGVAGGKKFIKDSILFKFNLDSESIYGGSFLAFKAGRRELVNTMLLNENLYPDFPRLSVPIFAIVEYCGYQVSCVGLLPIARSTQGLCYGSCDMGRHVAKNPVIAEDAENLAHRLNLAPHVVGEERIVLSHCVDIEIHEGSDGAFYIIDTARLMPPEYPSAGQHKSIFYYTLRPEFVMQYHKPLCADALSNFLANDPNRPQFDADIRQATDLLLNWHVPLACMELDRRWVGVLRDQIVCVIDPNKPFAIRYEIEHDYSLTLPTSRVVTEFMHGKGINLRHLGLMYYHLKKPYWKRAILHEIIARSAKNTLRSLLKYTVDEEESVDEAALMRAQIEFLNLLFGESIDSDEYWENEFSTTIYKLYFAKAYKAKEEMIAAKFSFKTDLDKKHLLSLLSRMFDTSFVNDKFVLASAFKSSLPFTKENTLSFLPEQYVTNFNLGKNMSIKKFGALYSLVDERGHVSQANFGTFLKLAIEFFEDSMRKFYSHRGSRNPLVLFYELQMITKLQRWCVANYQTHRTSSKDWYIKYDKIILLIGFGNRYLVFNRFEIIFDSPFCFEMIEKVFPGQLKSLLLDMSESLPTPRVVMPQHFAPAINMGGKAVCLMLLWRYESRANNILESEKWLAQLYNHVRFVDTDQAFTHPGKNLNFYNLEDEEWHTTNGAHNPYRNLFENLHTFFERIHNYDYCGQLVKKYGRESPWFTVRLLLLGCDDLCPHDSLESGQEVNTNMSCSTKDSLIASPRPLEPSSLAGAPTCASSASTSMPVYIPPIAIPENLPIPSKTKTTTASPMSASPFHIEAVSVLFTMLPSEILRRIAKLIVDTFYPVVVNHKKLVDLRKRLIWHAHEHDMKFILGFSGFEPRFCFLCKEKFLAGRGAITCTHEDCRTYICCACWAKEDAAHRVNRYYFELREEEAKFNAPPRSFNVCTFNLTRTQFMYQGYHDCETCRIQVCLPCSLNCHKDHKLGQRKHGKFYCDCYGNKDPACTITVKPPDVTVGDMIKSLLYTTSGNEQ